MRRKNMDNQNGDALSVRAWSQKRNKNKSSSGRSKSRGRSKSPGKPTKVVCWKCGKEGHFGRECKSKAPDKGKGSDDAPSAEAKTTSDIGGDVYLASSSTHVDHEAWLIDSGASFHFTPHREWFCEYEKYDGGVVFLGDDRKARIIGRGKVKLKLQGGRVRTLPGVLPIPALARNLISVSKLDDAVSWMSKNQSVVALSTTEAEYMAATHASKEAVWLQRLCSSMGLVQGAIRIDCDSQSAIFLAQNPAYHSKTKHIDVQYHFVRDMIEDKKVLPVKVDTLKNTANALTKSVSSE
eukprot:PITA_21695